MKRNTLFWFTHDLRLHDNGALNAAVENSSRLLCVYCIDQRWFAGNNYVPRRMGKHRWRFLLQSLQVLDKQLHQRGQKLHVLYGDPVQLIADIIASLDIDAVYQSTQVASDEIDQWLELQRRFPFLLFEQKSTHSLFAESQLPFVLDRLPGTFSKFRRSVEQLPVDLPLDAPERLPAAVRVDLKSTLIPVAIQSADTRVQGGEVAALKHLAGYFAGNHVSRYKETRNELDGFLNSTKFSYWLAGGCLSPRRIHRELAQYESRVGANESTHWIGLELFWREYFQWYAKRYGRRLFAFGGIHRKRPLTSFYSQRFAQWSLGKTTWPLVNACMNQLNATGYMSNRGRQIVASCLTNELQLDWRAGAYYFEMQLIDYDPASNWGNWQYIAGVGADPRGGRHFSIDKQTRLYDPDAAFIKKWQGVQDSTPIDAVDAADWPVMPEPPDADA